MQSQAPTSATAPRQLSTRTPAALIFRRPFRGLGLGMVGKPRRGLIHRPPQQISALRNQGARSIARSVILSIGGPQTGFPASLD